MASIAHLLECGQALWLDYVDRDLLTGGGLERLVDDGLRGVTSNPTIFHQAITGSPAYDEAILDLIQADHELDAERLYEWLAIQDIQMACDQLAPVYERTEGHDGFVSLEVSPHLAHDAQGSIDQARHLWRSVHRDNLMIKVPATEEGLTAIEALIAEGINVNVTLLFAVARYEQVFAAYIRGLGQNDRPKRTASVASFFVSRIDSTIDPKLEGTEGAKWRSQAAIANAKMAYQSFLRIRDGADFQAQAKRGAQVQRPLWASTSTKDPNLSPTLYVDSLIGPQTVNTVPPKTLDQFVNGGEASVTIDENIEAARAALSALSGLGIDLDAVTTALEAEGIRKFIESYDGLVDDLHQKISEVTT
ncbi:MAG: transaldolase, partial [Halofilum sp. (in: g-proteobacteria)]